MHLQSHPEPRRAFSERSSPECAPLGRGLKQMRASQASSLAFLSVSLHPGANEGGGRGPRSSRGSLQEDSSPGEGLAITGAQTGDKDCITERLFPSVYVPVSCLPRKSWGWGAEERGGQDVCVLPVPLGGCGSPSLVGAGLGGQGIRQRLYWAPGARLHTAVPRVVLAGEGHPGFSAPTQR